MMKPDQSAQSEACKKKMKKYIVILILALAPVICPAKNDKSGVTADKLTSIISEFSGTDGFEVINVGKLGTYALKKLIKLSADEDKEADEMLDIIKGINRVAIVDYEDCSASDKEKFIRKIDRILNNEDLIMEVKDDGDTMKMYGVTDDNSGNVSNFILHVPADGALICLFGTIPLKVITSAVSR